VGYRVSFTLPNARQPGSNAYMYPTGWTGADNLQVTVTGLFLPAFNPQSPRLYDLPPPSAGQTQNVFLLGWTSVGGKPAALVTISKSAISSDDKAARSALYSAFRTFRGQLAALEARGPKENPCFILGGADILANRAALALPLRLSETLGYYYNFDSQRRFIDLLPGMRLQIEPASYSYQVTPDGAPAAAAGYVTTGSYNLDVTLGPNNCLAFDSWSASITPSAVTPLIVTSGPLQGAEILGLVDLSAQGMARRYWRVIWPGQFGGVPSQPNDPTLTQNIAFIGANTMADLEVATAGYFNGQQIPPVSGQQPILAFFSGRAAVIPQFRVLVDDAPTWVAVGTTLRQLAFRAGAPALTQFAGPPPRVPGLFFEAQLWRWSQSADGYQQTSVLFDTAPGAAAAIGSDGLTMWDIPVVSGDRIKFFVGSPT
jgi:hypothetical protein